MIVAKDRLRGRGFWQKIRATAMRSHPRKLTGTPLASIGTKRRKTRSFWRVFEAGARLLLFHNALQRMLVLAREIHHLRYLGLGDFIGKHAALPDPMMMDVEHDLGGGFSILLEELLKHVNDEFHRCVIVV